VEPKIGHLKSDNRLGRCFLKGKTGDAINAVLAAAGSNMQKLLKLIAAFLFSYFPGRYFAKFPRHFLQHVFSPLCCYVIEIK